MLFCFSGCSSRYIPAPVSSLNTNVNDFQKGININGNKYTVQKGDTLYSIAFSAGQDFRTLAKNNSIPSPYIIYPGQVISLVKPGNTMAIANTVKNKKNSHTKIKQKVNKKLKESA
ncbi:LysM peptidoglycan-binding domain-containing protein [Pseudoalteromonas sp. Hal099]